MIKSFSHKGLERYFIHDDAKLLNPKLKERIGRILDRLAGAVTAQDMNLPSYRLHQLSGNRKDTWSVSITGNWRITFRFQDGQAHDVNLEDYH